jgi:hypothetical protein
MVTAFRAVGSILAGVALALVLVIAVEFVSAVVHPVPQTSLGHLMNCANMSNDIRIGCSPSRWQPGEARPSPARGLAVGWGVVDVAHSSG